MKISLRKIILFEITYKFNSFVLLKLFKKLRLKNIVTKNISTQMSTYYFMNVELNYVRKFLFIQLAQDCYYYRLLLFPKFFCQLVIIKNSNNFSNFE